MAADVRAHVALQSGSGRRRVDRRSPPRPADRSLALVVLLVLAAVGRCGRSASDPSPISDAFADRTRSDGPELRAGRAVYDRENCARCHTLFDRPSGDGSLPVQAPSEEGWPSRVGPDLGLQGHRHSDDWHFAHLYAPAVVVRGSPMPASRHLFSPDREGRPIPTPEGRSLVEYLQSLGREREDPRARLRRRDPPIPAAPPVEDDLRARGEALYERQCASCHGESGDGQGEAAPLLLFPPRDFKAGRYRFVQGPAGEPAGDADLYRSITLGSGIGAAMPSFDHLAPRDRWALVLKIKRFSPRFPAASLDAGSGAGTPVRQELAGPERAAALRRGAELWEQLGCASCHGAAGEGRDRREEDDSWLDWEGAPIPRSGNLAHACALRGGASPEAIDRALFGGGLAMPSFAEVVTGAGDRKTLRAYVLSLQDGPQGP